MLVRKILGKQITSVCLALLTALQPLTGHAQSIGEAIRNADKPLPHVLPIADRGDMLPLPFVPPQWITRAQAGLVNDAPKAAAVSSDDDDDNILPAVIAALKPVCAAITASPTSTTANTLITLSATCTFKGNLVRHYGFFRTDQATNLMTFLGDAPAGTTSLATNAPSTAGTYTYTVLALNGGIPSKPIPGVAVAVTVVAPTSCAMSGPNAANALAPNAAGTLSVSCTGGSTPFTYAWSRSTSGPTLPTNVSQVTDTPFTGDTPVSTTYSVTVSNSAGNQVVSKTVANSAAISVQVTSVALGSSGNNSTASPGATATRTLNATFSQTCSNNPSPNFRVYLNGTLAYNAAYVGSLSFDVVSPGTYRVDATLTCNAIQVAADTQSIKIAPSAFPAAPVPDDVEDLNAPNAVGNTVGTLPGSASVNPSGAVTYSIPMPVVPGTAGMQPSMALSYSSQAGRGIVGTGWSLSGFSTIHRCPATIVLDKFKGRVGFDGDDRYCMDGMRLIAIAGTDGGAGTEYRTERDSYARIYSYGSSGYGPLSWKVETKSGQTLTFNEPLYQSSVDGSTFYNTKIKAWGISRAEDTVANYMTFTYLVTHTKGWMLPTAINYTGNAAAGLSTYAQVQIGYDTSVKGDSAIIYDGTGSYGEIPPLVNRITSTDSSVTANAIAHQLNLIYESSPTTGRTRLASAKLCGGGADSTTGLCMPATNFSYNNAAVSPTTPWADGGALTFTLDASQGRSMLALDLHGTGKTELLSTSVLDASSSNATITNGAPACAAPYNICGAWGDAETPVALNTLGLNLASGLQLGDFNGDGVTDFVSVITTNAGSNLVASRYVVCMGQARTPGQASNTNIDFRCEIKLDWRSLAECHTSGEGSETCTTTQPAIVVGDFDGDGKSDMLELDTGKIYFGDAANVPTQTLQTNFTGCNA